MVSHLSIMIFITSRDRAHKLFSLFSNMSSDWLKRLLLLLEEVAVEPIVRLSIEGRKLEFPDPAGELSAHLEKLGIPQLVDYLAWIPRSRFISVEPLNHGGFGTVYKG